MEPLWSPAVATRGNRWQMGRPQERLKQAKPLPRVATGVDGSSPSEGLHKTPRRNHLRQPTPTSTSRAHGGSHLAFQSTARARPGVRFDDGMDAIVGGSRPER